MVGGRGEPAQVLHRDDSIYPLADPHGDVVLNTMWALDDFTTENGATRIVRGRHCSGGSRPPRPGVILDYVAGWLRPQENHVIGVPPELVATLPERLQELLGYNIYPPFVG